MRGRPLAVKVGIWVLARDKGDRATFAYRKWIASVNNNVVVARYTSGTMRLHHALDCTPNLPRLPGNRASGSGKISESMQDGAWGWWWGKQTALAQHGSSTAGPVTILGTCQGRHWFEVQILNIVNNVLAIGWCSPNTTDVGSLYGINGCVW